MRKSYKGLYRPSYPQKYIGDPKRIVYRSNLERKFMRYCDLSSNVVQWASEELPIRYFSPLDNKWHNYYPDFIVKMKTGRKFMIEIKPSRQCVQPKITKRKTKSFMRESLEYIKNQAKWSAAKVYCEDNDLQFKLITEKDIGSY